MTEKCVYSGTLFIAITLAVLLRWCVSLHSYSGQGTPPMFGDYEAQRHWMEITFNLPVNEWYVNTSQNDLMYWGLDYPPLTAYHSFVCGYFANFINPAFVALNSSRGYESYEHKLFMRVTVLVTDFLIYIPAVWWYFSYNKMSSVADHGGVGSDGNSSVNSNRNKSSNSRDSTKITFRGPGNGKFSTENDKLKNSTRESKQDLPEHNALNSQILCSYLTLIYPGLILVDYGHFQYNNISLGLTIAAIAALYREHDVVGSILFCCAVNYKQMELYHSIPFFCYLLGLCRQKKYLFNMNFMRLIKIGSVVIFSFSVIWFPFIQDYNLCMQLIHRVFPLARGVFEDKVANVWCAINIAYKLKSAFNELTMAKICLCCTFFAALPSSIDLLLRPNRRKFLIALINSSLAFFLFSFQVHEKSILLAAIPASLYFPVEPLISFWFLIISTFSMLPLLMKDGLLLVYVALIVCYILSVYLTTELSFLQIAEYSDCNTGIVIFKSIPDKHKKETKQRLHFSVLLSFVPYVRDTIMKHVFMISLFGCGALTLCMSSLQPPVQYPDLYPLLISLYSVIHFIAFFIYFNYRQFATVPNY